MSASMHPSVAQAAAREAAKAEPLHAAAVREAAARAKPRLEAIKAAIVARSAAEAPALAAKAWWRMPVQVRILLAMPLGQGDPEQIALTPWGALTAEQREKLGAIARDVRRATVEASLLV